MRYELFCQPGLLGAQCLTKCLEYIACGPLAFCGFQGPYTSFKELEDALERFRALDSSRGLIKPIPATSTTRGSLV